MSHIQSHRTKLPFILLLSSLVVMGGCRKLETTPKSEPFSVIGSPFAIYEGVRLKLSEIIPVETKIVRIDDDTGMTLSFSIESPDDGSVRLVEVNIQKQAQEKSRVSICSNKFSFLSSKDHDSVDSSVENLVARVFKGGDEK